MKILLSLCASVFIRVKKLSFQMRLSTCILAAVFFFTRFASIARAADELNLFAWSEYVPQSVIDGFTKETGIKVNYETYSSNEEMLSKLLAGMCGTSRHHSTLRLHRRSRSSWPTSCAPLDLSKVPNAGNILPGIPQSCPAIRREIHHPLDDRHRRHRRQH